MRIDKPIELEVFDTRDGSYAYINREVGPVVIVRRKLPYIVRVWRKCRCAQDENGWFTQGCPLHGTIVKRGMGSYAA